MKINQRGGQPRPSVNMRPPGIAGCVALVEGVLVEEPPGEFSMIIGRVVCLEGNYDFFGPGAAVPAAVRILAETSFYFLLSALAKVKVAPVRHLQHRRKNSI